jgi:hypothetical protein
VPDPRDELIPPDDPLFEGAEFLSVEARLQHVVNASEHLRGVRWRWAAWREREVVEHDSRTGEESTAIWDHDHCHFCYDTAFSERYEGDLREGWTNERTGRAPPCEQEEAYHWVCPACFERHRESFGWTILQR